MLQLMVDFIDEIKLDNSAEESDQRERDVNIWLIFLRRSVVQTFEDLLGEKLGSMK